MEVWAPILTGSSAAALVTMLGALLTRWIDHRAGRRNDTDRRLSVLEVGLRSILRDRIRYLGKSYLRQGRIDLDDRDDLIAMHDAYHALGGNGNLDLIMQAVKALPLIEAQGGTEK